MRPFTIGWVARAAGVNVETVRYYERRGLIARPSARDGAYRAYPPEAVNRIRGIKRVQKLGFSLDEIKELMTMRANAEAKCGDAGAQAERKMAEIEEKIRTLQAMKRSLRQLADACRMEAPIAECPILRGLGETR